MIRRALIFFLSCLPALAGQPGCPWTELEFRSGTADLTAESRGKLFRLMARLKDRTGKIRLYAYAPDDAAGTRETTSLLDERARAVREELERFLEDNPGWIFAAPSVADGETSSPRAAHSVEIEFHGYDDESLHAHRLEYGPVVTDTVVIDYARWSSPLYPAGQELIRAALRGRDPTRLQYRVSAYAGPREAKRGQELSQARLEEVLSHLGSLGVTRANLLEARAHGSVRADGKPSHRQVVVSLIERAPAPVRATASVPGPLVIRVPESPGRDRWGGQFGVHIGESVTGVTVSAERKWFSNFSFGATVGEYSSQDADVTLRRRVFLLGVSSTFYPLQGWEGPYARASLLASFYGFRGVDGGPELKPGLRTDFGIAAQRGLPFLFRAAVGVQYLLRDAADGQLDGWSTQVSLELGFVW